MMKASLVVLVRSECSGWVVGFLFSKLISCEMDVVGNSWRRGLAGRCFGVDFNQITGKPCKVRPCERRQLISCALLSFLSAQLVFLNSSLKFQGSGGINMTLAVRVCMYLGFPGNLESTRTEHRERERKSSK